MRLQLGLLNEDIAGRFDIIAHKILISFYNLDKIIEQVVKKFSCLPREAIRDNLPEAFIKTGNNKCQVILDCAEGFIERPKSLYCRAAAWSDYKHHNSIKFLVGISPSRHYYIFKLMLRWLSK